MRHLINCPELSQASQHHFLEFGFFLYTIKPWFLTEGKFATVLIIPSSWGSQLGGHPTRISLLITTAPTTLRHPRARTRTKVLLHRTWEAPLHGRASRVGIDLHFGQKPKLGGRYADDSLIYILYFSVLCISMFRFLYRSHFYFFFPKHKKTKNISFVSLYLPF
jgi:hypothetical protein